MAKKKDAEAPEASAADAPAKMKKSDAMREAIKRGIDMPQDACAFIKKEFGLEVTPQSFSTFKSVSKKKEGQTSAVRTRRGRQAAAPAVVASGPRVGTGNAVELAKQLKKLVDAYGVTAVREMTTVFE